MRPLLILLLLPLVAAVAGAQPDRVLPTDDWCDGGRWSDGRSYACEVREVMTRTDRVDLRALNGGVTVKQWDRDDVLVRARVAAYGKTQSEADRAVRQTTVDVHDGVVRAEAARAGDAYAAVSYEVFAPRQTDLDVSAMNGPVEVYGLDGRIRVEARNGPVRMIDVSGDVALNATNGPVEVELSGASWRGSGLAVEAMNGPITLSVPRGYSARLAARTNNSRISTEGLDYAAQDRQRGRYVGDALEATLGRGGPVLSLQARNGPVRLRADG